MSEQHFLVDRSGGYDAEAGGAADLGDLSWDVAPEPEGEGEPDATDGPAKRDVPFELKTVSLKDVLAGATTAVSPLTPQLLEEFQQVSQGVPPAQGKALADSTAHKEAVVPSVPPELGLQERLGLPSERVEAYRMRCDGDSFRVIAKQLGTSKSTASRWVNEVQLAIDAALEAEMVASVSASEDMGAEDSEPQEEEYKLCLIGTGVGGRVIVTRHSDPSALVQIMRYSFIPEANLLAVWDDMDDIGLLLRYLILKADVCKKVTISCFEFDSTATAVDEVQKFVDDSEEAMSALFGG